MKKCYKKLHSKNLCLKEFLTLLSPKLSNFWQCYCIWGRKGNFLAQGFFFSTGSSGTSYVEYLWAGLASSGKMRLNKYILSMFIANFSSVQPYHIPSNLSVRNQQKIKLIPHFRSLCYHPDSLLTHATATDVRGTATSICYNCKITSSQAVFHL